MRKPRKRLKIPHAALRQARYLSGLLKGGVAPAIFSRKAIADLKSEAHARGLTDADVDAELEGPGGQNAKLDRRPPIRRPWSLRP
jgi:hypothetical protein